MRSILLFPYVGPVVALAYTWTLLLDPNSGTFNALMVNFNIFDESYLYFPIYKSHKSLVNINSILFVSNSGNCS